MTAKFDPIIENGEGQSQPNNSVVLTEELWVEKYKPKYYTDLLSDDVSDFDFSTFVHHHQVFSLIPRALTELFLLG